MTSCLNAPIYSILLLSTTVIGLGLNDSAFKPRQNLRQESSAMDNDNNMVDNLVYGITHPGQWHDSLYAHHDCMIMYIYCCRIRT